MRETGGMIYWPAKAPGEVEDFAFDFTAPCSLARRSRRKAVTAAGVTKDSDTLASPKVTVWLSGGHARNAWHRHLLHHDNSTPPRTYSETAIVPIGEEPVSLDMAKRQTADRRHDRRATS
jgi:hypothetical protein